MDPELVEPMESPSTSKLCSTRAPVPASARWSCARRPSARAATACARSSTKSATSLSSPSNPSKKNRWRGAWLIGLAISVALLAWVLSKSHPDKVWEYAKHANGWLLLLTIVVATVTFPVRAIRWRLILRDADGRPFPWMPLWHATTIGFMANNLLPARAGEFARAYVASRQLPVRFTTSLGSIAVERVFDALVMLGLMAVAIAAPPAGPRGGPRGSCFRWHHRRAGGAQESRALRRRRLVVARALDQERRRLRDLLSRLRTPCPARGRATPAGHHRFWRRHSIDTGVRRRLRSGDTVDPAAVRRGLEPGPRLRVDLSPHDVRPHHPARPVVAVAPAPATG